jgi:hypothetical protein
MYGCGLPDQLKYSNDGNYQHDARVADSYVAPRMFISPGFAHLNLNLEEPDDLYTLQLNITRKARNTMSQRFVEVVGNFLSSEFRLWSAASTLSDCMSHNPTFSILSGVLTSSDLLLLHS